MDGSKPKLRLKKTSVREQLKQSELRNQGLSEYLEVMQRTCKDIFRVCAEQHEEMRLIILPGQRGAKKVFSEICTALVPIAIDDVNELRKFIHPELAAEIEEKLKAEFMKSREKHNSEENSEA